jgi:aspartate aminotransferase
MKEAGMNAPSLSEHYQQRVPSAIRYAQIEYMKRTDGVAQVNVAIGNVSLPMHPAMQERLFNLDSPSSPFKDGAVKYTPTVGMEQTRASFLNIIASSGFDTDGLFVQVTDGGSQAMELVILGCLGPAGSGEKPLLLIDPAYTNYSAMAARVGRKTITLTRFLQDDGSYTLPDLEEIERIVEEHRPGALLIIPYDNPTGQFYDHGTMNLLAELCVEHNMWMVSDEAYRELYYGQKHTSSIWGIELPGIEGRRISIETASKVWNACGLRIGALVTDSREFHEKAVAENTANLCPNAIGQYIFGALERIEHGELQKWYKKQQAYYRPLLASFNQEIRERLPGVIASRPDAAIYSVIDVRHLVGPEFDAKDFVLFCAREGMVEIAGERLTLLVAPMSGFYTVPKGTPNPGRTQMRIAYVEPPERMKLVPLLFCELLATYIKKRKYSTVHTA